MPQSSIKHNPRRKPRQKRAQQTIELILTTSTELLEEVGFDKLTTNLICERANLTPPALYRYFPNKYSILAALGQQLMTLQNNAIFEQLENFDSNLEDIDVIAVMEKQLEITKEFQGASWVMRALYATPSLAEIRIKSHDAMADFLVALLQTKFPDHSTETHQRRALIIVEFCYGLIEMLIDRPDLDSNAAFRDAAVMIAALETAS